MQIIKNIYLHYLKIIFPATISYSISLSTTINYYNYKYDNMPINKCIKNIVIYSSFGGIIAILYPITLPIIVNNYIKNNSSR